MESVNAEQKGHEDVTISLKNRFSDKTDFKQEKKHEAASQISQRKENKTPFTSPIIDNRPETVTQPKMQEMINNSPRVRQLKTIKEMINNSSQEKKSTTIQRQIEIKSLRIGPTHSWAELTKNAKVEDFIYSISANQRQTVRHWLTDDLELNGALHKFATFEAFREAVEAIPPTLEPTATETATTATANHPDYPYHENRMHPKILYRWCTKLAAADAVCNGIEFYGSVHDGIPTTTISDKGKAANGIAGIVSAEACLEINTDLIPEIREQRDNSIRKTTANSGNEWKILVSIPADAITRLS